MSNLSLEKIYGVAVEIYELLILNILWIGCTLLGGIIFGWAPSTVALLTILRDKIMKKENGSISKKFWRIYRDEFKRINIISIVIMILSFMVYVNRSNFQVQSGTFYYGMYILSTFGKWAIIAITLVIFPIYVNYNMSIKEYFMKSILIIIMRPLVLICIALWCWVFYSVFVMIPGVLPVFGIALFGYGIMAVSYQFFRKNEERLKRVIEEN